MGVRAMKTPLLLSALILSLNCHASNNDIEGDWRFVGYSVALNKCSELNKEIPPQNHENRKYAYKLWLGGYFTAFNMVAESVVLTESGLEGFYQELAESCRKNPEIFVGTMVSELSAPYLVRAMKSAGPNK